MISSSGSFSETTSNASSIQVLLFIIVIDGWRKINDMVAIGNSILLRNLENNSHPSKEDKGTRAAYKSYELIKFQGTAIIIALKEGLETTS
jgi:hypothetical protein